MAAPTIREASPSRASAGGGVVTALVAASDESAAWLLVLASLRLACDALRTSEAHDLLDFLVWFEQLERPYVAARERPALRVVR